MTNATSEANADARALRFEQSAGVVAAVDVARDAGILSLLSERDATPADVAARCGLDERMTVIVLDVLDIAGVVERGTDGTYRTLVAPARLALLEDVWSGLGPALRNGEPVLDVTDRAVAASGYPLVVEHLSQLTEPSRAQVVDALRGRGRRFLDLGAGAAPWSRALARQDTDLHVVAVDLPEVIDVTARLVESDGLLRQFDLVEGDLFTVELDGLFDVALIAGVCRLFGPDENVHLASRIAEHVRPGGTVAILDALPDIDRRDGRRIGVYALSLALRTSRGAVHPFSSYASWLYDAGFVEIELTPLSTPELSLITAVRPD